jgi:hypothetical protein
MYIRYQSAIMRSRVLLASFAVWAAAAVAALLATTWRVDLLRRVAAGALVTVRDANLSDSLVTGMSWVEIAAYVATGVAFVAWLHRFAANDRVLAAHRPAEEGAGFPASPRHATTAFLLFLGCGIGGYVVSLLAYQAEDPFHALGDSSAAQMISILLAALAAVAVGAAVMRLTRRQLRRTAAATAASAEVVPPQAPDLAAVRQTA